MKIKLSDYVFNFLKSKEIDTVFTVSGGAAAHLLDSLGKANLKYICNAHEQACAMAAEGYARIYNKPALVLVTNGPGSSNTITGVLGAFQESIPMIVISGQVPINQSMTSLDKNIKLRQLGVQECDIIEIIKSITKYSIKITNEYDIKRVLENAYYECMNSRKGPVWIDIPIDIQSKIIDTDKLSSFSVPIDLNEPYDYSSVIDLLKNAKKPLIITGNGIHLSNTESKFKTLINKLNIPIISSWTSKDLFNYDDKLFVGTYGIIGERAGNFALQSADVLLILGSRLSILNIGYQTQLFSPNSKKIMVDIDKNELHKPTIKIDVPIKMDLGRFFDEFNFLTQNIQFNSWTDWKFHVTNLKNKYPVFKENHKTSPSKINSFHFMEILSKKITNEIVVTDMGTSYTCTMQALRTNGKIRLFTSSACCAMGFGLPGSIGACIGGNKKVICIAGDGGFQMNIQELQTVRHYNLPIKIFILNNNGYSAISLMQDNLFNSNYVGSNSNSGVSAPNFTKIAEAYGLKSFKFDNINDLEHKIDEVINYDGPVLCEISMIENQILIPRVQSKKDEHGNIKSNSLENMFPYLPDDELTNIINI
jgi:acetolactate synthase I/II/III large subunit